MTWTPAGRQAQLSDHTVDDLHTGGRRPTGALHGPSSFINSSAVWLSLSVELVMMRRSGGESMAPTVLAPFGATPAPSRPPPGRRGLGAGRRASGRRRSVGRGLGVPATGAPLAWVAGKVVKLSLTVSAERSAFVLRAEPRRPRRHGAQLVVAGLVAEQPTSDARQSRLHQLVGERLEGCGELWLVLEVVCVVAGAEHRIAAADQVRITSDLTVGDAAGSDDLGAEPVVRAQLIECHDRGDQLVGGGWLQRLSGIVLVHDPPARRAPSGTWPAATAATT